MSDIYKREFQNVISAITVMGIIYLFESACLTKINVEQQGVTQYII